MKLNMHMCGSTQCESQLVLRQIYVEVNLNTFVHALYELLPQCLRDHVCTPSLKLNMHICGSTQCESQLVRRMSSSIETNQRNTSQALEK